MGNNLVTIGEAIDKWLSHDNNLMLAPSTISQKKMTLETLRDVVGADDYLVDCLTHQHFDDAMRVLANGLPEDINRQRVRRGLKARTGRNKESLEVNRSHLTMFAEFLRINGWVEPTFYPLHVYTRSSKAPVAESRIRPIVEEYEVGALLEAAEAHHPRTRIVVAIGLYMGLRVSSALSVQWKHVDLGENPSMTFMNVKRGKIEPESGFFAPLKPELQRWLKWYEEQVGPVDPDWWVIPGKMAPTSLWQDPVRAQRAMENPALWPIVPTKPAAAKKITDDLHVALRAIGWSGEKIKGQGMHTLRTTVARKADELLGLQATQSLLRHDLAATTQHYTRNAGGNRRLREAIKTMDPYNPTPTPTEPPVAEPAGNVVDLEAYRARRAG